MDVFRLFTLGFLEDHRISSSLSVTIKPHTGALNFLRKESLKFNPRNNRVSYVSNRFLFGMKSVIVQHNPSRYWDLILPADRKPLKNLLSRVPQTKGYIDEEKIANIWYRVMDKSTDRVYPIMQQVSLSRTDSQIDIDLYDLSMFYQSSEVKQNHVRIEFFCDSNNFPADRLVEVSKRHDWKRTLTIKENRIQTLVEKGLSSSQVAILEKISKHTVSTHRKNIKRKKNCFYERVEK